MLTGVATTAVDPTCARIISLKRDSMYSGRFKMEAVLFFIDGYKKETTRPV